MHERGTQNQTVSPPYAAIGARTMLATRSRELYRYPPPLAGRVNGTASWNAPVAKVVSYQQKIISAW